MRAGAYIGLRMERAWNTYRARAREIVKRGKVRAAADSVPSFVARLALGAHASRSPGTRHAMSHRVSLFVSSVLSRKFFDK